jgi:hypothetical protein
MERTAQWKKIVWHHPVWELVRYYRSLRGAERKGDFISVLKKEQHIAIEDKTLPVSKETVELLIKYIGQDDKRLDKAISLLRTEGEALKYCGQNDFIVGTTTTKNKSHHQSSKAMIASVNGVAEKMCRKYEYTFDPDPHNRCVWINDNNLHVTSRNLDGAIPSLADPFLIWEIKEYWGKSKGGSKMSDAVYECQLVGRELREFEDASKQSTTHVVFLDGSEQWSHRKSDLRRFIDLTYQGLIDHLIVGKEVETEWAKLLRRKLTKKN